MRMLSVRKDVKRRKIKKNLLDLKRSRDRDSEEENYKSFTDKLVYDINIGNISLSNGLFRHASFKPTDRLINYMNEITPGIGLSSTYYNLYYLIIGILMTFQPKRYWSFCVYSI